MLCFRWVRTPDLVSLLSILIVVEFVVSLMLFRVWVLGVVVEVLLCFCVVVFVLFLCGVVCR